MGNHSVNFEGSNVTVTIVEKGNTLLIRWGSLAGLRVRAINPSFIYDIGIDATTVSIDWGSGDRSSRLSWVCASNATAIAMGEDLVMTSARAKRQEDPANGVIV